MKTTSRSIITVLVITNIFLIIQVNVLFAGNIKKVLAPVKDALALFSSNSLAPQTPREATFDDEVNTIDLQTLINLYPLIPAEADFNEDAAVITSEAAASPKEASVQNIPDKKSQDARQLHKILRQALVAPSFQLNEDEEDAVILVTFSISAQGKIVVKSVNAPSKRVEEYVTERLSGYDAVNFSELYNHTYKVKIRIQNS